MISDLTSVTKGSDGLPLRPIEITKQFKTPKEAFAAYGLPVTVVPGVRAEPPRSFRYGDATFSRVELVAKKYYEDQGCLATWSEGVVFEFLREAVKLYVCAGLAGSYRYNRNIEIATRCSEFTWDLREDLCLEVADAVKFGHFLDGHVYFDLAGVALPPARATRQAYFEAIIEPQPLFDLIVSKQELSNQYTELISALKDKAGELLRPFAALAQKQYVATGSDKYGSSPYFLAFACDVLDQGGYSVAYNELEVFEVPGNNYDLTVFDPKTKQLRFVEVKNRDKLTHGQTTSLLQYLKDPVIPLELCIVRPE